MKKFILLALALMAINFSALAQDTKETAYERVTRTGIIRCGYGLWEPMIMKDPNTGALSGVFYDYMEALGKALSLKIEWTEEVAFGAHVEALKAGRFDVWCNDWPNAARGKFADYVRPIYYVPLYSYVRADDTRFDAGLMYGMKADGIKIATIDNEMSSIIAAIMFPDMPQTTLPQLSDANLMLMNVVTSKGDVTFTDAFTAQKFIAANDGKLKRTIDKKPLRVIPNTISVAKGEYELRSTLDSATDQLINDGTIELIIKKYEIVPGTLLRVAPAYEVAP